MIGNRVLSADGNNLGEVVGVIVTAGAAPSAVGYEIASESRSDNAFVPISEQMALSEDNLLLPAEATDFVRDDLAGFGAAVESYRSSALSGGGPSRRSRARRRSVVASDTAEDIGEVKGFVVDPSATRVDAVHVAGRGRRPRYRLVSDQVLRGGRRDGRLRRDAGAGQQRA